MLELRESCKKMLKLITPSLVKKGKINCFPRITRSTKTDCCNACTFIYILHSYIYYYCRYFVHNSKLFSYYNLEIELNNIIIE